MKASNNYVPAFIFLQTLSPATTRSGFNNVFCDRKIIVNLKLVT